MVIQYDLHFLTLLLLCQMKNVDLEKFCENVTTNGGHIKILGTCGESASM